MSIIINEISIQGGLYIQNNTHENMWVAIGYADDSGQWFSQGWLKLEPGEKRRAIAGKLTKQYYAYYARNANESHTITGNRQFWVKMDNWQKASMGLAPNEAAKQGFQSKAFRLVDIGHAPQDSFTVMFP